MSRDRLFHILCTDGEKIRYEGRFQMSSRKEAYRFLRDKIGRKNLYGLHFTITEFPIDVLREVVEAIIRKKPIPTKGFEGEKYLQKKRIKILHFVGTTPPKNDISPILCESRLADRLLNYMMIYIIIR